MYANAPFEISANAAADWFVKHLNAPEAADAPEPAIPDAPTYPKDMQPKATGRRGAARNATGN
jgi:hypothetical protein